MIDPGKAPFECEAESHPEDNTEQYSKFDASGQVCYLFKGVTCEMTPDFKGKYLTELIVFSP